MPKSKLTPYIFLVILIVILTFILGTRYGQKVEKTNKIIDYLLSLPPTKPPTTPKALTFKTYENTLCGIKFLIPSTFKVESASSESAKFSENGTKKFRFDCRPKVKLEDDQKTATAGITFQNKKLTGKKDKNTTIFIITNPQNGKKIYLDISASFFPLFEKTLEFVSF